MDAKRILIIESEAAARPQLQSALGRVCESWQVLCVGNVAAALDLVAQTPWDAVVSDAQLPITTIAEFFAEVARRHAQTLCVLRIDPANKNLLKQFPGPVPVVLPVDFTPEVFESTLRRAFRLAGWMANPAVRNLIPQMRAAPSLPALYTMVINELRSPEPDLQTAAMFIARDPALCAKMLRLANSAYFGLSREVSNAFQATLHLGVERLKSLILFTHFASQFEASPAGGFSVDQAWHHAMNTAGFARWIMQEEGAESGRADEAFTAGLLHDIGKLFLAANWTKAYKQVGEMAERERLPVVEAEHRVLGTTHAELGACLLAIWELPVGILDAIAWHHCPEQCDAREFSALTAVHVANAFEHEKQRAARAAPASHINLAYLESVSRANRCDRWREVCGCLVKGTPKVPSDREAVPQRHG